MQEKKNFSPGKQAETTTSFFLRLFVQFRPSSDQMSTPLSSHTQTPTPKPALLNLQMQMLILSRNTLLTITRIIINQRSGHLVAQLTHKINHYNYQGIVCTDIIKESLSILVCRKDLKFLEKQYFQCIMLIRFKLLIKCFKELLFWNSIN